MNLNETLFISIGILCGLLLYPKLTILNLIVIIIFFILGLGITNNYVISICVSIIITYIFSMLNSFEEVESFKSNKKKINKKKKMKKVLKIIKRMMKKNH